jgi:hypothetical protein
MKSHDITGEVAVKQDWVNSSIARQALLPRSFNRLPHPVQHRCRFLLVRQFDTPCYQFRWYLLLAHSAIRRMIAKAFNKGLLALALVANLEGYRIIA